MHDSCIAELLHLPRPSTQTVPLLLPAVSFYTELMIIKKDDDVISTYLCSKKERKKERKGRGRERRKREALSPVVYILFMSVTYSTDLHFVMSETVV